MLRGLIQSDQITAKHPCPGCNHLLPCNPTKRVYLRVDPLNLQLDPEVWHVECAAENHLHVMWIAFQEEGLADFPGKLYHRSRAPLIFEVVRNHLMQKFGFIDLEAEHLMRQWSEQQ